MTTSTISSDCAAAEAMWRELHESLAGWCLRATRDAEASEDIASEAFARLCSRWGDVRDPRGFLFVTATNLIRDHWREKDRTERLRRRLALAPLAPRPEPDPELRDLVDALPDTQRRVVLCYYFADLTVADTARLLAIPQGTIKRRLSDARGRLRASLAVV